MRISAYEVIEPIRENPVFQWFRARDSRGDIVAVQVPNPNSSWSGQELEALKDYFRRLSEKGKPGLLVPAEVRSDPDYPVVVAYPDRRGEPLLDALAKAPEEALKWWREASQAVHALHRADRDRPLLHGHIAPDSFILVDGRVWLTNFGYAPLLELGHPGARKECGDFLAPEAVRTGQLSRPADVYAFAKTVALWRPALEATDWYKQATSRDPADRFMPVGTERFSPMLKQFDALKPHLLPVYTLTLPVDPDGAGNTLGGGEYREGEKARIEAQPRSGRHFDGWTGDMSSSRNVTTVTMDCNKTVVAHFSKARPELTVTISPAGAATVEGAGEHDKGAKATVRLGFDDKEWRFEGWVGDLSGKDNPATVTMDRDKAVVARFVTAHAPTSTITDLFDLKLQAEPAEAGVVTMYPTPLRRTPDGRLRYPRDTEVRVQAAGTKLWGFDRWSGHLDGGENPATVLMDSDKTIVAHFREKTVVQLKTRTRPLWPRHVGEVVGAGRYAKGQEARVEAKPSPGWKFVVWRELAAPERGRNPLDLTMKDDTLLTALFARGIGGFHKPIINRKVAIMIVGSPVTLIPLVAAWTAVMALWAFAVASGLAIFVGVACLLVDVGIVLTRVVLGSTKLHEIAAKELEREETVWGR